jgi:RNA recognition motif-containing protein
MRPKTTLLTTYYVSLAICAVAWSSLGWKSRSALWASKPAFRQFAHHDESSSKQPTFRGDSKLGELHQQRIKTAGRVGTKRFVDPCKIFIGNLPFNCTEQELETWLCGKMGLPSALLINQIKIIRDWKTGKSKGYGFCVVTEAMYASVAIEKCHGQELVRRKVTVSQGSKRQTTELYVTKKKRSATDDEEGAIQAGLEQAEGKPKKSMMDPEDAACMRMLEPDLIDDDVVFDQETLEDDSDSSDSNDESIMNRAQRREAARLGKKKKPQSKGFGTS